MSRDAAVTREPAASVMPPSIHSHALRELTSDRLNHVIFVVVAVSVAVGYTVLLPFEFTQRLSLRNWQYLDGRFLAFSVAFGVAMGWVVTVQVYAMRRVLRQGSATLGAAGAVVGVLPSLLCCTPIVPTILAFVGLSGVSLGHTSGRIQYFFAANQNLILAAGLAVLVLSGLWSTRRVLRADCFVSGACDTRPESREQVDESTAHGPVPGEPSRVAHREPAGVAHE